MISLGCSTALYDVNDAGQRLREERDLENIKLREEGKGGSAQWPYCFWHKQIWNKFPANQGAVLAMQSIDELVQTTVDIISRVTQNKCT